MGLGQLKIMAGVAGLEPVTSAVTGQRSNQLSYTPAMGDKQTRESSTQRQVLVREFIGSDKKKIRAADAKEVGVGNPAEETCCYPNISNVTFLKRIVNTFIMHIQCFSAFLGQNGPNQPDVKFIKKLANWPKFSRFQAGRALCGGFPLYNSSSVCNMPLA